MGWVVSVVGGTYTRIRSPYGQSGAEPAGTCTPGAWPVLVRVPAWLHLEPGLRALACPEPGLRAWSLAYADLHVWT